jgi:hypothetical protein
MIDDITVRVLLWATAGFAGFGAIILSMILHEVRDTKAMLHSIRVQFSADITDLRRLHSELKIEQARLDERVNTLHDIAVQGVKT